MFSFNKRCVLALGEEHLRVTDDEGDSMLQEPLPCGCTVRAMVPLLCPDPARHQHPQHVGKCQALSRVPRAGPIRPLLSATLRATLGLAPQATGHTSTLQPSMPSSWLSEQGALDHLLPESSPGPFPCHLSHPRPHLDSYCHPSFP